MAVLLLTWLCLALGAPPELTVERARVAIELGEPARAAELALEAAEQGAPRARDVFIRALVAGGLGDRAAVEAEAVPRSPRPWAAEVDALDAALAAGDVKQTVGAAKAIDRSFPEQPDLLVPLWEMPAVPGPLRRYRAAHARRVAAQVKRRTPDEPADLAYAYRARLLLLAAGGPTDELARVLSDEQPVPLVLPRSQPLRAELASVLTNADPLELPDARPEERADLLDRIAEIALRERRYDRAMEAWERVAELGDTVDGVEGRARTLLARKDREGALSTVDAGMAVAVAPWPDDLAVIAADRRAMALVRLLDLRAEILVETHPATALADRGVADLLAGRIEASEVEDRAHTVGIAAMETLRDQYRAPAAESALQEAEAALEAGEHDAALKHAAATVFLFAWSDMADWRLDAARAHAVQARALEQLEDPQAALLAWEIALLLRPEAPDAWWSAAAALQQAMGSTEAAFARLATAHARAAAWDDMEALADLHQGPGDVERAARAIAVPVPPTRTSDQARITRGMVAYRFDSARAVAPTAAAGASAPKIGEGPRIGESMPDWSVQTTTGPVSAKQLRGRAVVLLFWVADCASCLQAIAESGSVARSLRSTSRDVAVVAVSMDPEERFVDETSRLDQARATVAHDPALGYRLGVTRAPTLFVIDPGGTLRYATVGWQGRGAFERALRRALSE